MPLTDDELESRLRAVLPEVRLVGERHLRKILHELADQSEPVAINPELPLWVERDRLHQLAILPEAVFANAGERLLLLTKPDDRFSTNPPDKLLLRAYWRLLVRARVQTGIHQERFAELGPGAELEARFVLEVDHVVPDDADRATLYAAFAAWYADLALFDPFALPLVFPSLPDPTTVCPILEHDVSLQDIYVRLRPVGAAERIPDTVEVGFDADAPEPDRHAARGELFARAEQVASRGNHVRAAILRTRAGASGWPPLRNGLVPRLRRVLGWDDTTTTAWVRALGALVKPAAGGVWTRAARALYDLQKIPADLEGELAIVDPIEWVRTLGRQPLTRTLTRARGVVLLRHLAKARRQLDRARIDPTDRERLLHLIDREKEKAELRVREELQPIVQSALSEAGFRPANLPEDVAFRKIVAELLDRVCENGYLRFGDLRDAVARNNLKMPDLSGPSEWVRGDALLRTDVALHRELDGVYHGGEIYLRWIQRATAAAFGTRVGRWLSKYVAFPFGGAFLAVEFGKYVVTEVGALFRFVRGLMPREAEDAAILAELEWEELEPVAEVAAPVAEAAHHGIAITPTSLAITFALGCFLLGVLYWPAFRDVVWTSVKGLGRGLRFAFASLPVLLWRSSPVRAVRKHPATRFLARHFGPALAIALVVALVFVLLGSGPRRVVRWSAITFGLVALILNTGFGRRLQDDIAEVLSDTWRTIRTDLIPGLVSWVVWAFRGLASIVERALYTVDEWFRFREGQSQPNLVSKAILAVVWFPVAYLTRFVFYLLVEPQVNPVKHFPVVTVSHKLIWPLVPQLSAATGFSPWWVGAFINGVPGIFGFIAWELKENWRLYEANRPDGLTPVPLGHHGETMLGLLRPGFHSGTVPSLSRKLRLALRRGQRTERYQHGLDDVAHAVHALLEREFLPLLNAATCWQGLGPEVGQVEIRVQSLLVELLLPRTGFGPLRFVFEHRDGVIHTRIDSPGWYGQLGPEQNRVSEVALTGLASFASAEMARPTDWADWVRFWAAASEQ